MKEHICYTNDFYIYSVAFSADGKTLAFCNLAEIHFLNLENGISIKYNCSSYSLVFSPDGKTLISAYEKKIMILKWWFHYICI